MKKIVFTIILGLLTCVSNAQVQLETRTLEVGDYTYYIIVPTLSNLMKIANMNVSTFKATMNQYKYHPDEKMAGTAYVYTNSSIDFFYKEGNNGKGINTVIFDPANGNGSYAGFFVLSELAYPRTCIQGLYQELAPYYTKTDSSGKRYYAFTYQGTTYGVDMGPIQNNQATVVHLYKFNK